MKAIEQGPVVRSMVSVNHWLSGIKTNRLSWYLTLVTANHASSNSAQYFTKLLFVLLYSAVPTFESVDKTLK